MNATLMGILVRWVSVLMALCIAAALVYRGNTYSDPMGPGMMAPTMCVLAAISLVCTTFAVISKSNAAKYEEYEAAV
jgi:hypothetical protein